MISQRLIALSAAPLHVAAVGAGAPILLLHGVLRSWQDFSSLLASLATNHAIVTPDLRGHGRSARAAGDYFVVDYARDLVELLASHFDQPAVILGHSLGAMLALAAAAALPDKVRAIVLEDPPFETMGARIADSGWLGYFEQLHALAVARWTVPELARRLAEVWVRSAVDGAQQRLGDLRDAAALRFAARCLAAADPRVLEPIVAGEWLRGFDWRQLVDRVECPVLMLQGDAARGGMLIDADARLLRHGLADCTFVRCEAAGHQIHAQQTEWTLRIVHAFLDSLEPAPGIHAAPLNTEV